MWKQMEVLQLCNYAKMSFQQKKISVLYFWNLLEFFVILFYCFRMVLIHSSGKAENMAVSEESCKYLSDLIKPLAANQSLEEMSSKRKDKIVNKLEKSFEWEKSCIGEHEDKSSSVNQPPTSLKGHLLYGRNL